MTSNEIEAKVKNEVLDTYPDDGISIKIPAPDDFAFQLTSTSNELLALLNPNGDGLSIINLGDCENLIKQQYGIPSNLSLVILKYEKLVGIGSNKSIQYEIYNPNNFTKIDLSICENNNIDIDIAIPIDIPEDVENLYNDLKDEGYDLFDRYNKFYIDICTPYQAENGADILLIDRLYYFFSRIEYLIICPSNCRYSSFSMDSKYLSCKCGVDNDDINLNESEKFIGNFTYDLSDYKLRYTSYKTMKCYKLVFSFKHFVKNAGSIILTVLVFLYLGFFIYFSIKGTSPLKTAISKILFIKPVF